MMGYTCFIAAAVDVSALLPLRKPPPFSLQKSHLSFLENYHLHHLASLFSRRRNGGTYIVQQFRCWSMIPQNPGALLFIFWRCCGGSYQRLGPLHLLTLLLHCRGMPFCSSLLFSKIPHSLAENAVAPPGIPSDHDG